MTTSGKTAIKKAYRVREVVNEPLNKILTLQHPISVLSDLVNAMQTFLNEQPEMPLPNRITLERDMFLVRLLTLAPLPMQLMRFHLECRKDNSGNLYKRRDGEWALLFSADLFKNVREDPKNYDRGLGLKSTEFIEHYIFNIRPLFQDERDLVFVPKMNKVTANGRDYLTESVRKRIVQFSPYAFGPVSLRHIVAFENIKNDGWEMAAAVLHTTEAKLRKIYATFGSVYDDKAKSAVQ